jgi:ABC-2 type transport system ATP-binding protein
LTEASSAVCEPAVHIQSLRLRSGDFSIEVDDWSAPRGACVAFIGRNGSGKTTILDSLLGLRRDADIRASMLGHDSRAWGRRAQLRQRLGVLLQRAAMPFGLYVREIAALHRSIYRRSSAEVMNSLGVPALWEKAYENLSRGEQQRVELFFALAHDPELIILDEPLSGLDQRVAQVTANIVKGIAGSTVLMACHSELELSMADQVVWLENGAIRECDNPQALRKRLIGEFRMQVSFHREQQATAFVNAVNERIEPQFVHSKSPTEVLIAGDEALVRAAPSLVAEVEIAALQYGPTTLADLLYRCAHADPVPDVRFELRVEGVRHPEIRNA